MKRLSFSPAVICCTIGLALSSLQMAAAPAPNPDNLKLKAQLIWGTNEEQSSDPSHKSVGAELAAKLKESPYRWKNYFEINAVTNDIPLNEKKTFKMSEPCQLDIKNVGNDRVEINIIGQGNPVALHKEKLAVDWPLILSGNAKGGNAWMVVIKKLGPPVPKAETKLPPKPETNVPAAKPGTNGQN